MVSCRLSHKIQRLTFDKSVFVLKKPNADLYGFQTEPWGDWLGRTDWYLSQCSVVVYDITRTVSSLWQMLRRGSLWLSAGVASLQYSHSPAWLQGALACLGTPPPALYHVDQSSVLGVCKVMFPPHHGMKELLTAEESILICIKNLENYVHHSIAEGDVTHLHK